MIQVKTIVTRVFFFITIVHFGCSSSKQGFEETSIVGRYDLFGRSSVGICLKGKLMLEENSFRIRWEFLSEDSVKTSLATSRGEFYIEDSLIYFKPSDCPENRLEFNSIKKTNSSDSIFFQAIQLGGIIKTTLEQTSQVGKLYYRCGTNCSWHQAIPHENMMFAVPTSLSDSDSIQLEFEYLSIYDYVHPQTSFSRSFWSNCSEFGDTNQFSFQASHCVDGVKIYGRIEDDNVLNIEVAGLEGVSGKYYKFVDSY